MPQVPYNPVPSVAPTEQGTPSLNISSPAAAFGGSVGQALEGLGHVEEHVGDEIFRNAVSMQQLQNESEAKEADAQYMIKSGEMHANFSALQGQNAVKAYPKYVKDLQDLRQGIRGDLSNDMARKLYDGSSLSTMGRTIFNGAGHAAQQNKVWALGGSKARQEALFDRALSNPEDEGGFQAALKTVAGEARAQGNLGGWGRDQTEQSARDATSKLWSQRIVGLAKTDPFKAQQMLADHKDEILGQHQVQVESQVRQQLHTTGSRNISDATNAGWGPWMQQPDIDKAVGVEDALTRVIKKTQQANPDLQFTIDNMGNGNTREVGIVPLAGADRGKVLDAIQQTAEDMGIDLAPREDRVTLGRSRLRLSDDYDVSKLPTEVPETERSRVDRAEAYSKRLMPDDVMFHDTVRQRTLGDSQQQKRIKAEQTYRDKNIIDGALLGDYGHIPTTREELLTTDPKVADAYNRLDEQQKLRVTKQLNQHRQPKDDLDRYQTLLGMFADSPSEFTNIDILSETGLTDATKKKLIGMQNKARAGEQADPQMAKAIKDIQPDMYNAGITRENKDIYFRFIGSFQDALEDWQHDHEGKMPTFEERKKIGAQMLQTQKTPWLFGLGTSQTPLFDMPVPSTEAQAIKADPHWAADGITPTDEQIRREYIRKLFKQTFLGANRER